MIGLGEFSWDPEKRWKCYTGLPWISMVFLHLYNSLYISIMAIYIWNPDGDILGHTKISPGTLEFEQDSVTYVSVDKAN